MNTKYKDYIKQIAEALSIIRQGELSDVIRCLALSPCIYFCGNGGSAANASHFSQDLFKYGFDNSLNIKTVSLVDSVPIITATANDSDYSCIFSNVVSVFCSFRDALVIISGSGSSENIVKAATIGKEKGVNIIALVGFDGGTIKKDKLYTHLLHVKSYDMEVVESVHAVLIHYITHSVIDYIKDN